MRTLRPASYLACAAFLTALLSATAAPAKKALILGTTVQDGASSREASSARTAGFDITVVDAATWMAMTREGFAAYDMLILGDPDCGSVDALAPAEAHPETWGAAVNGNVVVILTDPDFHAAYLSAPQKLMDNAVAHAGAQAGRTGLYASLSCYYSFAAPGTPVPALSQIGSFTVQGQGFCPNSIHIVDSGSPVVSGLSDLDLSNWGCSAHGGFDTWPATFKVVAMVRDIPSSYVAPDGTTGTPYILANTGGSLCDAATLPRPDALPFGAFTWTAELSVSDADGLIARNVALGPRNMADQLSVPYFHLETTGVSVPHGELTPAGDQPTARTRLVGFREFFGDPAGVEATYAVDRVPAGSRSCLIIHQRYEFGSELPDGGCEPSGSLQGHAGPVTFPIPSAGSLPCNRWKPGVDYEFIPADGDVLVSINIPQRLFFRDGALTPNVAATFQDDDQIKFIQVNLDKGIKVDIADPILRRQDIGTEATFNGIHGGAAGGWDNYHQSFNAISGAGMSRMRAHALALGRPGRERLRRWRAPHPAGVEPGRGVRCDSLPHRRGAPRGLPCAGRRRESRRSRPCLLVLGNRSPGEGRILRSRRLLLEPGDRGSAADHDLIRQECGAARRQGHLLDHGAEQGAGHGHRRARRRHLVEAANDLQCRLVQLAVPGLGLSASGLQARNAHPGDRRVSQDRTRRELAHPGLSADRLRFCLGATEGAHSGRQSRGGPDGDPMTATRIVVLTPAGFPKARRQLDDTGWPVVELDLTEPRKKDGGFSCLSLRL